MAARFSLGEVQNSFQVGDAHLSIIIYEIKNAETGSIGTGQKYLGTRIEIKMFQSHVNRSKITKSPFGRQFYYWYGR